MTVKHCARALGVARRSKSHKEQQSINESVYTASQEIDMPRMDEAKEPGFDPTHGRRKLIRVSSIAPAYRFIS
jgi:hypothetical protein